MAFRTEQLELFKLVSEYRSFSRVADITNQPQPTISRHIKQLEQQLGIQLFERNNKRVELTTEGEQLLPYALNILHSANEAQRVAKGLQSGNQGQVTIEAPPGFVSILLQYFAFDFKKQYPGITLNLVSLRFRDYRLPMRSDIRLHPFHPVQDDLLCRKITDFRLQSYASNAFLQQHPDIVHPSQFAELPCLTIPDAEGEVSAWPYQEGNDLRYVNIKTSMVLDDVIMAQKACMSGLGIALLVPGMLTPAERKQLRPAVADHYATRYSLNIYYRDFKFQPANVRKVIESLEQFNDEQAQAIH